MRRQIHDKLPRSLRQVFDACCWIIGSLSPSFAAAAASPQLSYSVDARLGYVDLLRRPNTSGGPKAVIDLPTSESRTLGLQSLRLGLDIEELGRGGVKLGFRPDALAARGIDPVRDYDGRAGTVYRREPTVRLLDTYELSYIPGPGFQVGVGVYDEMLSEHRLYDPVLAFGLETRFPRKSLAIRLAWADFEDTRSYELLVFEGQDDRGETLRQSTTSYDQGTTVQDPNRGMAINALHALGDNWRVDGGAGYSENLDSQSGRRSELFAKLGCRFEFRLAQRYESSLYWESRWARESWRHSLERLHSLQQYSHSLSSTHEIAPALWLILGGQYGHSEHPREGKPQDLVNYKGWQGELGLSKGVGNNLEFSLTSTNEYRRFYQEGTSYGGFINERATRTGLKRIAFAVRYLFDH